MTSFSLTAPTPIARDAAQATCFHCGLPTGARTYPALVDGVNRATCCPGCQAVAQLIAAQGMSAYYRNRNTYPQTPSANPAAANPYAHYDAPQVQAGFVTALNVHHREATLLLEGVTCAACLWLIEQRLQRLAGVILAAVNHGAHRVRLQWDESATTLSAILAAIAALGYRAHLYDNERSEALLLRERRALLWRLFVAAFGMMQVMMYAFPAYITADELPPDLEHLMQWAGLALTLPVMLISATPFYRGAWRGLLAHTLNKDVPVSLGILTAFAASVWATVLGAGTVYYDSVCMFVFLLLGTRFLELNARTRAAQEQDRLARLAPAIAQRLKDFPQSSETEDVPAALLRTDDVVLIKPGTAAPGDGVIVEGSSSVNEALLTGESHPLSKKPGDRIIAGSVNGEGALTVRLTHIGAQTVVAGIVRLMDRALEKKPRLASVADAIASKFVLALLVVVALSAAAWWWIDATRVLPITIALLVVTCPCALSLATPAALIAATGSLMRQGILVTRACALETLAHATHFVFDKTGTLTSGQMRVTDVQTLGSQNRDTALAMAAALEQASEHPVGRALVAAVATPAKFQASQIRYFTGQGVEGIVDGVRLRAGTPAFVAELNRQPMPHGFNTVDPSETTIALASETAWVALFSLTTALRPDASRVVRTLTQQSHTVHMLSGDRNACVESVARHLGIRHMRGAATPEDKLNYVRELQSRGAVVAAIGDGVNDAPVLALAQVSVSMAAGAELAQLSADIALLTDHLEPLLHATAVARRTLGIIHQNFAWAVAYNLTAVPLAATGHLTPWMAALGMSLSSLLVIGNALRLCRTAKD